MSILAAVMPAPRVPVEVREFAEPALEPGSALLRTLYSEVCGTDVHIWHGRLAGVPIRSFRATCRSGSPRRSAATCAVSTARASARATAWRFSTSIAPAATAAPAPWRGRRRAARRGASTASPTRRPRACSAAGRRQFISSPAWRWRCCPASLPAETFISAGCGLITAVHAIDRAAIVLGDTVLVQGTGAVGLSAIALARLAGAARVIAFGAPADRLELARAMGADAVVDVLDSTVEERQAIVRELTAGARRRRRHRGRGIGARRRRGARHDPRRRPLCHRRALHRRRPEPINVHQQINRKHLEIRGCWGSEVAHFVRALRVLERTTQPSRGAPSAPVPTRSRNSIRRSPTLKRCGCQKRLSVRTDARIAAGALAIRLASAVLALLILAAFGTQHPAPADSTMWGRPSPFWDAFVRHDSGWYFDIARKGYDCPPRLPAAAATSPSRRCIRC